jgi:GntR family transcriptional regulator
MLRIDPRHAMPIWRQIEQGVRHLVASRVLEPGDGVPSVRDLARDLGVNPATVAKAYQSLGDDGVLEVRRGEGTYVSGAAPRLSAAERSQRLRTAALAYAGTAITLGIERDEATALLGEAYDAMEGEIHVD